jgi:hypothetical protein
MSHWWDKILRKNARAGYQFCDSCGEEVPVEDLHHILIHQGMPCDLYICESCTDLPPSSWKMGRKKR